MVKKAGTILLNIERKEIVLVCRNGEYSFPKGHLEESETIQECAIRETKEETGHDCHLLMNNEISIIHYKNSKGKDVEVHFFIAIDDGKTKDVIMKKDREITTWKKYDEIEKVLSYENLKEFWAEVKDEILFILNEKKSLNTKLKEWSKTWKKN